MERGGGSYSDYDARAAELKKQLQRLVKTIVDDEDYNLHSIDQARDVLSALRAVKFNKRSTVSTVTSSLKLHEPLSCPPQEFVCPLSKKLMRDPVILSSGQTYDRPFIQKWLKAGNRTCPQTQQVLSPRLLTKNIPSFHALFGESVDAIPRLLAPLSGAKSQSGLLHTNIQEDVITTLLNLSIHMKNSRPPC
ncbi:U-box domain-containing protein 9-like [Hibiscus syriacus]|uniref:U-box domain-containing protein 9-like n=1 Tax=Hibiscus syriacus TaxID=106335 RepID=UPI00192078D5|nr:U-box domain-containing protein 9-like [Hibiscus syriacus]